MLRTPVVSTEMERTKKTKSCHNIMRFIRLVTWSVQALKIYDIDMFGYCLIGYK